MKYIFILFFASIQFLAFGQTHKRALFIGNSYTYYNDLPALTSQIAHSMGDTLDVDSSTPGGTTFAYHCGYAQSQEKIAQGGWDFVVLQEQSQTPAMPINIVEEDCYPYAAQLNDTILKYSPCAETMFYMTWGRENGDADNCDFWPPVCTYEGMDDLLRERYMAMGEMNDAVVAPVGAVRRSIRENFPDIQLYASDGSHPSPEGSYAAAVVFYTGMFRRDPLLISFDYSIDDASELIIKQTVHDLVFENMTEWFINSYDPIASLQIENISGQTFLFTNTSVNADEVFISNSAEGTTIPLETSTFEYTFSGMDEYQLCVTATRCGYEHTACYTIANGEVSVSSTHASNFVIYPNPSEDELSIKVIDWRDNFAVSFYNSNGSHIRTLNCKNDQWLDVSGFAPGLYFLDIKFGEKRMTQQWLKH